jgi:CxxC motif-containing protein (DUF1111 family)
LAPRVEAKEPAKAAEAETAKAEAVKDAAVKAEAAPDGRELFAREWLPNDSRAHGGDGLGPVFNDSSCVACHNQAGAGGGGPASKNVDIITAFSLPTMTGGQIPLSHPQSLPEGLFNLAFGALAPPVPEPVVSVKPAVNVKPTVHGRPVAAQRVPTAEETKLAKQREKEQLSKIHPGFASSRSVVLHHFGTDPKYQEWRAGIFNGQNRFFNGPSSPALVAGFSTFDGPQPVVAPPAVVAAVEADVANTDPVPTNVPVKLAPAATPTRNVDFESLREVAQLQNDARMKHPEILNSTIQTGNVQISHSQRNPTALFGIGLIDAIPEKAIVELAKLEQEKYPDVAGRPAKQKNGKIGRFGWKAQKPSLEDFALTACAVELGLNVPGHEQAGVPLKPDYKAPGLDMNMAECDALVSYLRNLPAPVERKPATAQEAATVSAGHKLFASVGCAKCHVEKVATANGVYSDLLLHDMGPELGDSGDYGVFTPDTPEEEQDDAAQTVAGAPGALPQGSTVPHMPQSGANPAAPQLAKLVGALRQEWRTPPLWGVRDSGPYLHDGRADTLEQAIAFHGGQGAQSALKFFSLKPDERRQLISFLKSLTAPEPTGPTKLAAR